MFKRWLLIFLILGLITVNLSGCRKQEMSLDRPVDFNFVLDYGLGFNANNPNGYFNQIDTFKSTCSKDMVTVPPISTELKLSNEELDTIYKNMRDINILDYPDKFTEKSNSFVTPHETYRLKVQFNGITKNIYWEDKSPYFSTNTKAVQLRELFRNIDKMVSQSEEYKKLPESKGGYA